MCPVYYFNIKINLDIYNYLGLFFKYNNDLDSINQSLNSNLSKISAAIIATRVTDLNNPPNAFILNTAVEPVGLPSYLGCNGCVVIQQNPGDKEYSAQLAFSFGSDKIAIRRRYGGEEWTNWKYFTAS